MLDREARSKPVPSLGAPLCNDGSNDDSCHLCGDPIGDATARRVHRIGDPPSHRHSVHAVCLHEYDKAARALGAPRFV